MKDISEDKLKDLLAKGKITQEQYDEMRDHLSNIANDQCASAHTDEKASTSSIHSPSFWGILCMSFALITCVVVAAGHAAAGYSLAELVCLFVLASITAAFCVMYLRNKLSNAAIAASMIFYAILYLIIS